MRRIISIIAGPESDDKGWESSFATQAEEIARKAGAVSWHFMPKATEGQYLIVLSFPSVSSPSTKTKISLFPRD